MPTEEDIRELLRRVVDPEIGANVVDLGLVYRIALTPELLQVDLTMTSPACPMSEMILDDAREVLEKALPEGCRVELELVWDPPWDPSMMSERTRAHFGW